MGIGDNGTFYLTNLSVGKITISKPFLTAPLPKTKPTSFKGLFYRFFFTVKISKNIYFVANNMFSFIFFGNSKAIWNHGLMEYNKLSIFYYNSTRKTVFKHINIKDNAKMHQIRH